MAHLAKSARRGPRRAPASPAATPGPDPASESAAAADYRRALAAYRRAYLALWRHDPGLVRTLPHPRRDPARFCPAAALVALQRAAAAAGPRRRQP